MEHRMPNGSIRAGYFCSTCGGVTNMFGTGHGPGVCQSNPELVQQLVEANKSVDKR